MFKGSKMIRFIFMSFLIGSLGSCQTSKDSILLGIGIGGALGGTLGSAMTTKRDSSPRKVMTGAALGMAAGGLIGWLQHRENNMNRLTKAEPPFGDENLNPFVTRPEVRRVWVPDRIEGNKYIRGHYIYVIERPSVWRRD